MGYFKEKRMIARLSITDCCDLFGVREKTVKGWDKSLHKPPRAVFLVLDTFIGDIGFLSHDWHGFRFFSCEWGRGIISPEGGHIWSWEVSALPYLVNSAGLNRYDLLNSPFGS